jgi:hypothetical protein
VRRGGWARVLAVAALSVTLTAGSRQQPTPQPSITVAPSCAEQPPLRLRITVTGVNFRPGDSVRAFFDSGRANQLIGDYTSTGNTGSFVISDLVTAELDPDPEVGGYVVEVFARQAESSVDRVFRVPCPTAPPRTTTTTSPATTTTTIEPPQVFDPTLTLSPAVGPPGFVAIAIGTGWPPGPVTIGTEARGRPITAVAGADGSFRASVLVLRGTSLGQLGVQGTGAGGVSATGSFLVVPRGVEPPLWNR